MLLNALGDTLSRHSQQFYCVETKASEEIPTVPKQRASSKMGPAAQRLIAENKLSKDDITPTGPQNIITKGDVLKFIASGGKSQQPFAPKQPLSESTSKPQPSAEAESRSKGKPLSEQQAHSNKQLEASKAGPAKAAQQAGEGKASPRKGRGVRYTDIPNSQIRKIIAQRLQESKQQIPSMYLSATADVDAVSALRQSLKDQGQKVIPPTPQARFYRLI